MVESIGEIELDDDIYILDSICLSALASETTYRDGFLVEARDETEAAVIEFSVVTCSGTMGTGRQDWNESLTVRSTSTHYPTLAVLNPT